MRLCVLIFNAGTDNEGIYTLSVDSENTVVAFESEEDAQRYALLLEAQDFLSPQIESIDAEEIKRFCEESSLRLLVVEAGQLVVPPEKNKEALDWQPERQADTELDRLRARLEQLFRQSD
jgi:hypothetical protein